MPAYEYLCNACGNRFERRQKMSEPDIAACPSCGGPVKRLISGGAGVIASGSSPQPSCGSGEACCMPDMGGCGGGCGCGH